MSKENIFIAILAIYGIGMSCVATYAFSKLRQREEMIKNLKKCIGKLRGATTVDESS